MKVTPTSGPISASMTHHERDVVSSRHSLRKSHVQALLCEGKEDLLEVRLQVMAGALASERGERVEGAFGDDPAAAQQHEAVADFGGIGDLMDGEKESAV